jgi:MFS transporter, NNP family, nitrate/nitrite transporter
MTDTPQGGLNLLRLEPRIKVLHLTWLAFFVSFVVWFNHAPLMAAIRTSFNLTDQEVSALLILNVALTPSRGGLSTGILSLSA